MSRQVTSPEVFCVNADSVQVTTGAASANVALPNAANGAVARYVRVTSKGNAYIRPGLSGVTTAAATAILIIGGESIVLNVQGFTHLAHIQETAASIVQITPLEVG